MKHLMSGVVNLLGALFGVLVLSFTGYQTWMLLFEVSQNAIVATIGLILFEGGTIYWWSIFKSEAKGIMQMALSLLLFVFGLLLMVGSNGLHLGAIDPTFLGQRTPERLILVAAVISLVGKLLFPLLSPEMTQNIWQRALQGMLLLKALTKTEATLEGEAQRIANTLGADMARLVELDLYTQYHIPHNLHRPALSTKTEEVIEGEVVGRDSATQRQPQGRAEGKGTGTGARPHRGGVWFSDNWGNFFNALVGSWKGKKQPAPTSVSQPGSQRPKVKRTRITNREPSSSSARPHLTEKHNTRFRQMSRAERVKAQAHAARPQPEQQQGNTENRSRIARSREDADQTLREFAEKYKSVYGRYPENPFLDPAHFDDKYQPRRPEGVSEEQFEQWHDECLDVLNWRHPLQQEQQEQTDGNGVGKDSPLAR